MLDREATAVLAQLRELWLGSTCAILGEITGERFEVHEPADTLSQRPLCVWTAFRVSGALAGRLSFGIPHASREAPSFLLPQDGQGSKEQAWEALSSRIGERWMELLHSQLAMSCRAVLLPPIQDEEQPHHEAFCAGLFAIVRSGAVTLPIHIAVVLDPKPAPATLEAGSTELGAGVAPTAQQRRDSVPKRNRFAHEANARETSMNAEDGFSSSLQNFNTDLLLDIELQAALRFGGREMPLHEILELGTGDVVSLDRPVQAPVDLVVGDRIVARGEVVLVDGNYGLRVTEVAEPRKRLETIRCLF